jgi:hypothetical protein
MESFGSSRIEHSDWKDWFTAAEYYDPWEESETVTDWLGQPLDLPHADCVSKHLIQLLQEQYKFGRPVTTDRVTTERCHHVLKQLLEQQKESIRLGGAATSVHWAKRADAILQCTRLFENRPPMQGRQEYPTPRADREMYNLLLLMYGQTVGGPEVPGRAKEIVDEMRRRFKDGDIDLKPNSFHWNCVLLAWKESNDPEKSVEAAKLLVDMYKRGEVDPSSFVHMFRICAHHHPNETLASLGARVAVKVWQETIEEANFNVDLSSFVYAMFLQAIKHLPDGKIAGKLKDKYFDACLGRAKDHGKVNTVIVQEFLVNNKSKEVFEKYFGPYASRVKGLPVDEASRVLVNEYIPMFWKEHADVQYQ